MKWLLLVIMVFSNGDQFVTFSMLGGTYDTKHKCAIAEKSFFWNMGQGGKEVDQMPLVSLTAKCRTAS